MTETIEVASTDGVTLELHHFGGSGPPLLICHATGFHGRAYMPLAAHLVAQHDVWAIDFRGHGASTPPDSCDFAWRGMAADILAAVAAIDRGPVCAVGHSMGGAAILQAAAIDPAAIASAYLFEPVVYPAALAPPGEIPVSAAARRRRTTFANRQIVVESYGSRPPLDELHPDALAAYVEFGFVDDADGNVTLACEREHEALTFEGADVTIERIAPSVVPALIAVGAPEAGLTPAQMAPGVAETLINGELRRYPDLGHFGPLQDPELIAADILDWFGQT